MANRLLVMLLQLNIKVTTKLTRATCYSHHNFHMNATNHTLIMKKTIFFFKFLIIIILFCSCQDEGDNNDYTTIISSDGRVTHIQASKGTYADRIEISWKAVSGISQYNIYRSFKEESDYELIGTASDTSYNDTAVLIDNTYFYRVRSSDEDGLSDFSQYDTGYLQIETPEYAYSNQWGSDGTGDSEFAYPEGIAIKNGKIYVIDRNNHRVQVFSEDRTFLFEFGSYAFPPGDGTFYYPSGIAVDDWGYIYIADQGDRVQKFDASGSFVTSWGTPGTADGEFNYPSDIAIDKSNDIYVIDQGNHRVQKFSLNGTFIKTWGENGSDVGQFIQPRCLAIDNEGFVYVSSWAKVQKFTSDGVFVDLWGNENTTSTMIGGIFKSPWGIEIDSKGYIYIVDKTLPAIHVFTSQGVLANAFSLDSTEFSYFAISSTNDLILTDFNNHKIHIWTKQ